MEYLLYAVSIVALIFIFKYLKERGARIAKEAKITTLRGEIKSLTNSRDFFEKLSHELKIENKKNTELYNSLKKELDALKLREVEAKTQIKELQENNKKTPVKRGTKKPKGS